MCSDCGEEEPEVEEAEVDTEAPRTLRGRTKLRKPGKYRFSTDSIEGNNTNPPDVKIDANAGGGSPEFSYVQASVSQLTYSRLFYKIIREYIFRCEIV
jgi:hypothetical protein